MPRIDTLDKCRFGLKLLKFLSGVLTWWAVINPGNLSSFFLPPFSWLYEQRHCPERKKKNLNPFMGWILFPQFSSVQSLSHVWLFATLWTAARQTFHHQFPESTQTQVHRVSDAIQPSHPLSSPSPPALNLSQHQGLFQWVSSSPHYPPNIYNL